MTDVMEQVQNWESVGKYLHVPYSKLQEINQHPSTVREKSKGVGCFWVNSDPDASWEVLAGAFYWKEEGRAAAMVTQYLPNGTFVFYVLMFHFLNCKLLQLSFTKSKMKMFCLVIYKYKVAFMPYILY